MKVLLLATVVILAVNSASVSAPDADAPLCDFCKAAVREFKVIIDDKNTRAQLDMIKTWFCTNIRPDKDCPTWWDNLLNQAFDWINNLDDAYTCKAMEWCANFDDEDRLAKIFSPVPVKDDDPFCEYCHLAFNELKKAAHDPDVQIMTKDLPDVVCNIVDVPGCKTAMTLFFQYGLEYCQNIDVTKICISWNECKELATYTKSERTCKTCTQVADFVGSKLNFGGLTGKEMCGFAGLC